MAAFPAIDSADRRRLGFSWSRLAAVTTCSLTLAAVATVAVPGAHAQDSPVAAEAFSESIDVELVNVDVWVLDRDGEPIRGLPASAFEVHHDGEPVEVTNFTAFGPADEAAVDDGDPADPGPGDPRPVEAADDYLILYVDQLRLQPRDYQPVLRGLRQLLAQPSVAPERVLVLRQNQGLAVEAHLGSSPAQLEQALERLGEVGASGIQASAELDQALDSLRREWKQSKDLAGARGNAFSNIPPPSGLGQDDGARGALGGAGFGPDACDLFVQRVGPIVAGWTRSQAQRTSISLGLLSRTTTFLAGLPGVKTVLYVGGGLETNPGASLSNYVRGLCPSGEAAFSVDELGEQMSASFLELTRHLNSNRVTVYAYQSGSLRASPSSSASADGAAGGNDSFRAQGSFDQRRREEARAGLDVLAGETGGRRVTREDELARLAALMASRYSLAYPLPAGRGTEHRITVEVDAPGVEVADVRHRRSYLEKTPDERLAELVQGALYLGMVENSLGLRLGAGDLRQAGDGEWLVPLRVMVPVSSMTFDPATTPQAATLKVQVVARNLETGKLWSEEQSFRIKQPEGAALDAGQLVQLPLDVTVEAGPCSIVVGARDEVSKSTSVVSTALEAGPPRTE